MEELKKSKKKVQRQIEDMEDAALASESTQKKNVAKIKTLFQVGPQIDCQCIV